MDVPQANVVLGAKLRGLRGERNYSRLKLSQLSGVPVITIRRIEAGQRAAGFPDLLALTRALGANLGALIDAAQRELEEMPGTESRERRRDQ